MDIIKQIKKRISGWTIPVLVCLMVLAVPALTQAWFDKGFEKEDRQEKDAKHQHNKTGRLFVHPTPEDVRVRIMNIKPPYHDGIELDPGSYQIRVDKDGYKTQEQWERVRVGEDLDVYIELEEKQKASVSSSHQPGDTWTDIVTGMEFVWAPGGCYMMGCGSWTDDCDRDEKPVHEVCVDGFWMGKYEVTQGEWEEIMSSNPSRFDRGHQYPVERVTWNDCQDFIRKLNSKSSYTFRLPTEAEWEYAARSRGKKEKYAGGNNVGRLAWYISNSRRRTHKVGTKAPNGLGLYDMSGNVWEWCKDVYDEDAYTKHSRKNPVIPWGGSRRVYRGGGWGYNPGFVRAADRSWNPADYALGNLGLRLCVSRVR